MMKTTLLMLFAFLTLAATDTHQDYLKLEALFNSPEATPLEEDTEFEQDYWPQTEMTTPIKTIAATCIDTKGLKTFHQFHIQLVEPSHCIHPSILFLDNEIECSQPFYSVKMKISAISTKTLFRTSSKTVGVSGTKHLLFEVPADWWWYDKSNSYCYTPLIPSGS